MRIALLFLGIVVLCMPRWLSPLARRLDPRERVRGGVAAVAVAAFLVEFSLVLFAAPAVSGALGNESLAKTCSLFGDITPGRLQLGCAAALLAVLFPTFGRRGWMRTKEATERLRVEPSVGIHHRLDGIDVVQVPLPSLVAYSIGGPNPQIVVSEGLVALLAADELDVVVEHEVAHVREGHGSILRFLVALETPAPPLRRITASLRVAMERQADEAAIRRDPSRRIALLDALLKVSGADAPSAVAAFNHPSGIVERAEALLAEPATRTRMQRIGTHLALAGAAACGVVAVGGSAFGTHLILSLAGICCI